TASSSAHRWRATISTTPSVARSLPNSVKSPPRSRVFARPKFSPPCLPSVTSLPGVSKSAGAQRHEISTLRGGVESAGGKLTSRCEELDQRIESLEADAACPSSEGLVVRHHRRYPSFGSRRR